MENTSLGFQKPKEEEYYDINIFNQNAQLANDLIEKNSSAIGQIANDRGYLNSKSLGSDIDLNNFFIQGKYYSSTCLNRPNSDAFIIDISGITSANSAITQKATCYYGAGNVNFGKTYERTYYAASGGWTVWKETADGLNTPIIKSVPDGITLIRELPHGIYHIYNGATLFTDYPTQAKNLGHNYGLLEVKQIAGYKTYDLIAGDGAVAHSAQYTGFSAGGQLRWNDIIPYSITAATGITIAANGSYIRNGIVYVYLAIRKTDGTDFPAGTQVSAALLGALNITYPKVVSFTCWDYNGNVLRGAGGNGTVFVNKYVLVVPPVASGLLRIAGSFTME